MRSVAILLLLMGGSLGLYYFLSHYETSVTTTWPTKGKAVEAVYATGVVEPVQWAKVAPTMTARIIAMPAQEGDKVGVGAQLVQLDDGEVKAQLAEIEAKERFARSDSERIKSLAAREHASSQSLEKSTSELRQIESAKAVLLKRISEYTLRSPLEGTILRKDGEEGEVAQAGQTLFWVGQCCALRVIAEIDEEDMSRIHPGQKVLIKADAFPGEIIETKLGEITPKGDPVNKTYRAKINLPPEVRLMVGMTVEVNVVTREDDRALLLPTSTIVDGKIWVVKDGKAQRRTIRLGASGDNKSEIMAGIAEHEAVITAPLDKMKEGLLVKAANP